LTCGLGSPPGVNDGTFPSNFDYRSDAYDTHPLTNDVDPILASGPVGATSADHRAAPAAGVTTVPPRRTQFSRRSQSALPRRIALCMSRR